MMRQIATRSLVLTAVVLTAGAALASEAVGVNGSKVRYPAVMEMPFDGKPVRFALTGTALRSKAIFNVYAIASYVQEGVKVGNADELAAADVYKILHLVMERDVSGKDMAEAFVTAIRRNYPQGFDAEVRRFDSMLGAQTLKKSQHIVLTWLPKTGLRCQVIGTLDQRVDSPAFARAVWDIYFGKQPVTPEIKAGLSSRL
jgi:hypothetical protein